MIITLVSGGSGSVNIQEGLYKINPDISLNILINGYDDGKSTGILRKLFKNTLGISDFRKNQILEYKLIYGDNDTYKILNYRITSNKPNIHIQKLIDSYTIDKTIKCFLKENTEYFFELEQSKNITYKDFNYMNIIYCSLLHKNNFNMMIVCNIIKVALGLKNNIYINSNKNLILQGITKNNKILLDEASIVNFNDKSDKIIDVKFDKETPLLNKETKTILLKSDLIILSCGTQFSSLIPTYKTLLFKETFKKSKAKKYLVLNCDYDNDIINYTGDELLDKINEYISLECKDVKIIISDDINDKLFPTKLNFNYINIPKLIKNNNHDGYILWKYILEDYFNKYYNKKYIFDYDYTLFDKTFKTVSNDNIKKLKHISDKIIVTNNSITNLIPIRDCIIYSNISNIKSLNNDIEEYVNSNYILNEKKKETIQNILHDLCIFDTKIRENMSISINSIYNRDTILETIKNNLLNTCYDAIKTGKTTIEIIKKGLCKRELFIKKNFLNSNYTYITDVNDIEYNEEIDNIKYLEVKNINTTNLFLNSLIMNKKYDFCIIAGGINKRMKINYPKCLIKVDNKIVLLEILNKIKPYANNIYICCNIYYYDAFMNFEKKMNNLFNNLKFLYFNSIDNLQNYPKGNGETIYQLLENNILTDKVFIIWSDILISNNKIFEEMYNLQYNTDFLIPTVYETDPYAYLILSEDNRVLKIEYKHNISIEKGYHDQCIFLCDTIKIKNTLNIIINKEYYDEINFLDIVNYIDNVTYYETKYPLKSFNFFEEI